MARRVTHETDFYFQGHFPGDPIVPAVILVEMLAQAGGLAAGAPRTGEPLLPSRCASRVSGRSSFRPLPARATCSKRARGSSGSSADSTKSKAK